MANIFKVTIISQRNKVMDYMCGIPVNTKDSLRKIVCKVELKFITQIISIMKAVFEMVNAKVKGFINTKTAILSMGNGEMTNVM